MGASGNILSADITESLLNFKRKYYLNSALKGSIYASLIFICSFITINVLEYNFYFSSSVRAIMLFSFIGATLFGLYKYIITPLLAYYNPTRQMSDEQAAKMIGDFYPEISDKLLNTIQLAGYAQKAGSDLVWAGVKQKTYEVIRFPFLKAINFGENKKYLKYLYGPVALVIVLSFLLPQLFTQGTTRIINFNKKYEKARPFAFELLTSDLTVFKNENLDLVLKTPGVDLEEVTLYKGDFPLKMKRNKDGSFSYTLQNINSDGSFYFSAIGYESDVYNIKVVSRPFLQNYTVHIDYPDYLGLKDEKLENTGNLTLPEGSRVTWNINAQETDELSFTFEGEKAEKAQLKGDVYTFNKTVARPVNYQIGLTNEFGTNKEPISNYIEVIPDKFPEIKAEDFFDTLTYSNIYLVGTISDDYGFSALQLNYRITDPEKPGGNFSKKGIGFEKGKTEQRFAYNYSFDELKPGQKIEYYLSVSDNDGVNGAKTAKTGVYTLAIPDKKSIEEDINNKNNAVEKKLSDMLKESKKARQETKKLNENLKTKNNINWNENKQAEEVLKKHQQMTDALENLKEQFNNLNKQKDKFGENNEAIKEKAEQLQKLMNELLDEETKKLMDELEKLLQERKDEDQLKNALNELNKKDLNLEKQLERALELFKQLQFEEKLDKTIDKLNKLAENQDKLAEKTEEFKENSKENKDENGNKKEDQNSLNQKQEELNKEFDDIKKEMDELRDLNEKLENKNDLENTEQQENDIEKDQQESSEQMKSGQNKKASKSQKAAADKMKQMADKMQKNKESMEAEAVDENIEDLRNLLENLVKLSFDQEDVMKQFRGVNQTDPKFIALSQKQLKIKDDSKVIEDSLYALAKRVFQIESFITKELTEMNGHIDQSVDFIKQRRTPQAGASQQFAMSSMNNLALLLNDVLKQLQAESQSKSEAQGNGSCKKPGNGKPKPGSGKPKPGDMGKMQKDLNDKIAQLKGSGKQGRQLSEELAKLAQQQEMLRNALKELEKMGEEEGGKQPGGKGLGNQLSELKKQMEETEKDLYNKRLTNETIMRQQEILTRLLEAEKAVRERELDPKREAQTGKDPERKLPPKFEEYLRNKEKQVELLKTVSPEYNKYYKNETNKYFEKLSDN